MSPFFKLFRVDTPFDGTNRFQTSYILSPAVLAIIRLIISVYAFTTLIYKLVYDSRNDPHPNRHWSFFTNITYWGIAFYFLVSSFHGIVYSRTGTAPLQRWPRILQLLHGLFYSTVVIFPFIVYVGPCRGMYMDWAC